MSNALQQNNTPPPPPEPDSFQQSGIRPAAQSQQPQPPPELSHEEAVAALRHFHAIQSELEGLLKNPQIGKADIKSSIIDGTTKLVSERIMTPAVAVAQLSTVPDNPREQRAWVMQHYQQTMAAQAAVLDHHRASGPGTQDWTTESQMQGNPDKHIETMAGVMQKYKGR